jgi:membrane fusion protein, multidrug efflux system
MQWFSREERFGPGRSLYPAGLWPPPARWPGLICSRIAWRSAAIVLAGSLTLLGCGKQEKQVERPPPAVATVTVEPHNVPVSMDFIAQTQSSQQVEIYARVTGFLDKRVYREGAIVKAGDVLFQMDQKPYEVQVAAAKAALAQQQARLTTAQARLNRVRPLVKLNALAQKDLDNATGEVQASQAAVDQAKANLAQAELNLSYTTITSPVTGITSAALQQDGTYIGNLNTKLTSVAVVSPMWVNYSVSENQLLEFRKQAEAGLLRTPAGGQTHEVEISLPDGSVYPYKGQVTFQAPSFDASTGTYLVRATVNNPDGVLRPNQYVRSRVLGFVRPDAILVPQRAVRQTARGHAVWVVDKDGKAELRPVVVGDWHGDDWFISDGLNAGEKVIVDGSSLLQQGALVKAEPLQGQPEAQISTGSTTAPGASPKR